MTDSLLVSIEAIIFLGNYQDEKNDIKKLFEKNNFALFLLSIIQVKEQDELEKINSIKLNTRKNIKHNIITNDKGELDHDLTSYLELLEEFWDFFNEIHRYCDTKNGCNIKNIDKYYKDYNNEYISLEDIKDVFDKIKLIRNIFGFFSIIEKKEFVSNLDYLFKYNIILASLILLDLKNIPIPTNNYSFNRRKVDDYIFKINKWYELTKQKQELISKTISERKIHLDYE